MVMFQVEVERVEPVAVCRLHGDLDAATVTAFREVVSAMAGEPRLVVDLGAVPFIDSAGLGALVAAVRRARSRGGDMALCVRPGPVGRVLALTGLDRIVAVGSSVEECTQMLAPAADAATL